MNVFELKAKRYAAVREYDEAQKALSQASLAAQDGSGSSAAIAPARKALNDAGDTVAELQGAIEAFEAAEVIRLAAEDKAAAEAETKVLDAAIREVRRVVEEYESTAAALVQAAYRIMAVERTLWALPNSIRLQSAVVALRSSAMPSLAHKLREWVGESSYPVMMGQTFGLLDYLPVPSDGVEK